MGAPRYHRPIPRRARTDAARPILLAPDVLAEARAALEAALARMPSKPGRPRRGLATLTVASRGPWEPNRGGIA